MKKLRTLAVAMALGYRRGRTDESQTNDMREAFIGIQTTIEAIDRAISHEKLIADLSPGSLMVPILDSVPPGACRADNRQ